jgi:hypothetical protein
MASRHAGAWWYAATVWRWTGVAAGALAVIVGGCASKSSSTDATPSDTGADLGRDTPADTRDAPSSMIVCCPIETPTCDCFGLGGTRNGNDACPKICDAAPINWQMRTDSNGCPILVQDPGGGGCLTDARFPDQFRYDAADGTSD